MTLLVTPLPLADARRQVEAARHSRDRTRQQIDATQAELRQLRERAGGQFGIRVSGGRARELNDEIAELREELEAEEERVRIAEARVSAAEREAEPLEAAARRLRSEAPTLWARWLEAYLGLVAATVEVRQFQRRTAAELGSMSGAVLGPNVKLAAGVDGMARFVRDVAEDLRALGVDRGLLERATRWPDDANGW